VIDPVFGAGFRAWSKLTTAGSLPREIGRAFARANLLAATYLPWLGAWTLAGATQLIFLRSFLARAAHAEARFAVGNDLAMVLASWSLFATTVHLSLGTLALWIRVVCALLAVAAIGLWLMQRRARRDGARLCFWFALTLLAQSTHLFIPELQAALVGLCLLAVTLRFERIRAAYLFLPALAIGLAYAIVWRTESVWVIIASIEWPLAGLLAGAVCVIRRIRQLQPAGRGQALVLLTGFLVAGFFALFYVGVVFLRKSCTIVSTTAECWLYRHQDWWLILPLLTHAVFSIFAVFFKGQIDASILFRRATVYAALTVLAIFAFGVLETTASELLSVGFPRGTPPAIAAGAIALLIHPVKKRCDSLVERLLARLLQGKAI
jgi:hypothetical protein